MLNTDYEAKNAACIDEIETLTHELLWLVSDMDALRNVKTHIQSSISVLHAKEKLDKKENLHQLSTLLKIVIMKNKEGFFPQRRKRKGKTKPSNEEVNKAKKKMAKTNVKVCGICWKEDNHELNVKDKDNIT